MMFTKKVLLGSLGFVISLLGGNVVGAIAQNADRYLTDSEIQNIRQSFQRLIEDDIQKSGDMRSPDQISKISNFISTWRRGNLSVTPFLGDWRGYESSLAIYPSNTKDKVCLIGNGLGRFIGEKTYGVGMVSGDQLLTSGEIGERILIVNKGKLRKYGVGELRRSPVVPYDADVLLALSTRNGKRIEGRRSFAHPYPLTQVDDAKLSLLGCSSVSPSAPSNTQAQISTQGLQNLPDGNYAYKEVKASLSRLDSSRYFLFKKVGSLVSGHHFQPYTDWNYCFTGQLKDSSLTNITNAEPRFGRGLPSGFDFTKDKPQDLSNYQQVSLSRVEKVYPFSLKRLQECINLFPSLNRNSLTSNSIPSSPSSTTPVKLTDTIAKYPTNENFEKVDRILQASSNPESLVNLKGNQQKQRRKSQKE